MKVDTHIAIGVATWAALLFHFPNPLATIPGSDDVGVVLLTFPLAALGSMLPDLDHPHAAISESVLLRPLAWGAHHAFHHRGILHSLLAVALVLIGASYLAPNLLAYALAWGYLAHILADFLTVRGVPLLAPLSEAKLHLPLLAIHTGSLAEILYLCLILVGSIVFATGHQ